MPELPEVETTRRGIAPHVEGATVREVIVRERRLRWPVTDGLEAAMAERRVTAVRRRAKYLLLQAGDGHAIVHLGMSGSLRIVQRSDPAGKHDHVDVALDSGQVLRFNDPRRFGCWLWTDEDPARHSLIRDLGPEPLSDAFDGARLHTLSRGRRGAVKNFIMDGAVVVGVGNIYASEALFAAGIHPARAAGRISLARYERLADEIRAVLRRAIDSGGSTLRDFLRADGSPGYFQLELHAYGRPGEPCHTCGAAIRQVVIGQRSSFYCPRCQR